MKPFITAHISGTIAAALWMLLAVRLADWPNRLDWLTLPVFLLAFSVILVLLKARKASQPSA